MPNLATGACLLALVPNLNESEEKYEASFCLAFIAERQT